MKANSFELFADEDSLRRNSQYIQRNYMSWWGNFMVSGIQWYVIMIIKATIEWKKKWTKCNTSYISMDCLFAYFSIAYLQPYEMGINCYNHVDILHRYSVCNIAILFISLFSRPWIPFNSDRMIKFYEVWSPSFMCNMYWISGHWTHWTDKWYSQVTFEFSFFFYCQ